MEKITSRKNQYIARLRRLASDGDERRSCGETVLDGMKLLGEALANGARVTSVLCIGEAPKGLSPDTKLYCADAELVEYASPVKNSAGPVFTVALPRVEVPGKPRRVIVLEAVQDPGNVGTVIRAAAALGADAAVLVGDCADLTSPRVMRASMGACFRFPVLTVGLDGLGALLEAWGLPLYGAALLPESEDIRAVPLDACAVAVGNEGRGLSGGLLSMCAKKIIIPMDARSESLNAAMAASLIIWEMVRSK